MEPTSLTTGKPHNLWRWLILAAVVVAGLFAWTWYALGNDAAANISSFDECAAAGYPIAESYPEQCIVPGGPSFTRMLTDEEQARLQYQAAQRYTSTKGVEMEVYIPGGNQGISSPLSIFGQVPGSWSFEASFPIEILNSQGEIVAQGHGELQDNWMTDELVTFIATLEFEDESGAGKLVLKKDNPSGLTENDDSVSIDINFK